MKKVLFVSGIAFFCLLAFAYFGSDGVSEMPKVSFKPTEKNGPEKESPADDLAQMSDPSEGNESPELVAEKASIHDVFSTPTRFSDAQRKAIVFNHISESYRKPVPAVGEGNSFVYSKDLNGEPTEGSGENLDRIVALFDSNSAKHAGTKRLMQVTIEMPNWSARTAFGGDKNSHESQSQNSTRKSIISKLIDDLRSQGVPILDEDITGVEELAYPTFYFNATKEAIPLLVAHPRVRAFIDAGQIDIESTISNVRVQVGASIVQILGVAEGDDRKIAILDSGTRKSRFDSQTTVDEYCALDDINQCQGNTRSNAEPCFQQADNCGHGTMVASAAIGKSSKKGIVPEASLVSIRVHQRGEINLSSIERGLQYLLDEYENDDDLLAIVMPFRAKLTSGLFTSIPCSNSLFLAADAQMLVLDIWGTEIFSATGNDESTTGMGWPACNDIGQAVAGTEGSGTNERIWDDFGEGSNSTEAGTDMLAPAQSINLLQLSQTETSSGTSFSAPIAAGVYVGISEFFGFDRDFLKALTVTEIMKFMGTPIEDQRVPPATSYTKPRVDMLPPIGFNPPNPSCGIEFVGCVGMSPQHVFTFSKPAGMPNIPVQWEVEQQLGVAGPIVDIFEGVTGICLPTSVSNAIENIFTAKMKTEFGVTECTRVAIPVNCGFGGQ